jgi:hypothetical protein
MATGYNDKSKQELKDSYLSYKSVDFDEETDCSKLTTKEVIKLINEDEFIIEKSKKRFDESESPMNNF